MRSFKYLFAAFVFTGLLCQFSFSYAVTDEAKEANNKGFVEFNGRDIDAAITDYTKAIELSADFALAYYNRGLARREKNDAEGEIADYTKAIELDPQYTAAYYNRGLAREEKGDL